MTRLRDSDAVAKVLEENPPALDDVAKARMEKRILEAAKGSTVKNLGPPELAPAPSNGRFLWAAGVVAVAAAIGLGFFALQPDPSADAPRAEFETYDATTRQRGTLEVGSTLRTDGQSEGDIGIADSRIHIEPSTVLYLGELSSAQIDLELTRGQIRVEFHPRVRGEEAMSIHTPHAVVQVIGTVFVVQATETFTEVSVTEGQVRVTGNDGEEHMVGAHDAVRVGEAEELGPTAAADVPTEPVTPGSVEADEPPLTERARQLATPAQRLSQARSLIRRNEDERALTLLNGVVSAREASPRTRAAAYTVLGDLQRQAGNNGEARAAYEGAIRQRAGSLSDSAYFALGRLQERRLNDPDAARASYRSYLDQAPGGPLSGQVREALCRLGDATACPGER